MSYYQSYNPNKFKNIRQEYNGVRYDSKKEANKAYELNMLKKAGEIKDWQPQWKIPLNVSWFSADIYKTLPILTDQDGTELKKRNIVFQHLANYYVDFRIEHNDGSIEYLEIKSKITMTPVWKLKWALCEAIFKDHPTIFLRVEL